VIKWELRRAHYRCDASGAEIAPGEEFHSALAYVDGEFVRRDYALPAWEGQDPSRYLSHWRQRRPEEKPDTGPRLVDHRVLMEIFEDLKDSRERPQQCFVWLIALLLVRARKLRYVDLIQEDGATWMVVRRRTGKRAMMRIRDPVMTRDEEERVQENLTQLFEGGLPEDVEAEGAPAAHGAESDGSPASASDPGAGTAEGGGEDPGRGGSVEAKRQDADENPAGEAASTPDDQEAPIAPADRDGQP